MTGQHVRKEPKSIHSATPYEIGIMLIAGKWGVLFIYYALTSIFQHLCINMVLQDPSYEEQNSPPRLLDGYIDFQLPH